MNISFFSSIIIIISIDLKFVQMNLNRLCMTGTMSEKDIKGLDISLIDGATDIQQNSRPRKYCV